MTSNINLKIFCDENIPRQLIKALREVGIDVVSVQDLNLRGAPDDILFNFAINNGYIIFTENIKDFSKLLKTGKDHHGILFLVKKKIRGKSFGQIREEVIRAIQNHKCQKNWVEYIDP